MMLSSPERRRLGVLLGRSTSRIDMTGGADADAAGPWAVGLHLFIQRFPNERGHRNTPLGSDAPQTLSQVIRND
jgi:hypothetical protein